MINIRKKETSVISIFILTEELKGFVPCPTVYIHNIIKRRVADILMFCHYTCDNTGNIGKFYSSLKEQVNSGFIGGTERGRAVPPVLAA